MSREEFYALFRHELLALMAEAWAVRREPPGEFGRLMDAQMHRVRRLVGEMYDALRPKEPVGNGKLVTKEKVP